MVCLFAKLQKWRDERNPQVYTIYAHTTQAISILEHCTANAY